MATSDKRYFWRDDDLLWYKDAIIYELNYELNNRTDWAGLPLRGILQLLEKKEEAGEEANVKAMG
jgi:predicted trehalose synthase